MKKLLISLILLNVVGYQSVKGDEGDEEIKSYHNALTYYYKIYQLFEQFINPSSDKGYDERYNSQLRYDDLTLLATRMETLAKLPTSKEQINYINQIQKTSKPEIISWLDTIKQAIQNNSLNNKDLNVLSNLIHDSTIAH